MFIVPITILLLGVLAGGFAFYTVQNAQTQLESLEESVNTCRQNLTEAREEVRMVKASLAKERNEPEPAIPTCPNTSEEPDEVSFGPPFNPVRSSLTRHQQVSHVAANRDEAAEVFEQRMTEDELRFVVSSLYLNALEFQSAFVENGTTVEMGVAAHELLRRHKEYTEELESLHNSFDEYPYVEKRQTVREILKEFERMYDVMLTKT